MRSIASGVTTVQATATRSLRGNEEAGGRRAKRKRSTQTRFAHGSGMLIALFLSALVSILFRSLYHRTLISKSLTGLNSPFHSLLPTALPSIHKPQLGHAPIIPTL